MQLFVRTCFVQGLVCCLLISSALAEGAAAEAATGTFPEASTLILLCVGIAGVARFLWKSKPE